MGHAKRTRQHNRSTKVILTEEEPPYRKNLANFKTVTIEPTKTIATDQTDRFPKISSRGNQYVMVSYLNDTNGIIVRPLKNRLKLSLIEAYKSIYEDLAQNGNAPKLQLCDNEFPKAFNRFISEKYIDLQLVAPYNHRNNPAEKTIDTLKSYFISGLDGLDPLFTMHL